MGIIYILIPIAIILTSIGIYLFFWAVKTEQFDDLEKQGLSILFDEDNDHPNKDHTAEANTKIEAHTETDKIMATKLNTQSNSKK